MTVREAAAELDVTEGWVLALLRMGVLRGTRRQDPRGWFWATVNGQDVRRRRARLTQVRARRATRPRP